MRKKGWKESRANVEIFIEEIKDRLRNSYSNLTIIPRDKTRKFRIEYGLTHELVCEEIMKLDVSNYSYTDNDDTRPGHIWIFGQILLIPGIYEHPEVYMKMKLSSKVICLSFHEKEYELSYPYNY